MLYDVIYKGNFVGLAIDYDQAVSMITNLYGFCDNDELLLEEIPLNECNECCYLCQYGDECASSTLLEAN